jgi:hypothetical protein
MERLKRNPGAWLLMIGGVAIGLSTFLRWFEFTNVSTGSTTELRAFQSVTGQTLLLIGTLILICGFGVAASSAGGRFLWGGLGLLLGGVVLAGAIWGLVDPESFAANAATTQAISKLSLPGAIESASDTATKAFADGTLTVSVQIGLWFGLLSGLVATLGGLLSFRKKRPAEE